MAVQTPTQAKLLSPQLRSFLSALETTGANERNREAHRSAVERLGEFMAPRGAELAMPSDLRAFLSYLGELGVSQQSQGVYRSVLVKWMEHLATLAPGADLADDGEATGVLDYSKEPDPVDDEQTWPLRHRRPMAEASEAAAEIAPVAAMSADFGSAFDAAAAAARQAETVVMTAWADDGTAAEAEILSWDDARVAAPPRVDAPMVLMDAEVVDPSTGGPADIFEFAAAVPPAPAPLAPPSLAFAAPLPAPAMPAALGFGAESGDFGDSTMVLSGDQSGFGTAPALSTPALSTPPAAPPVELPAFLRAPAMPTARSVDQDAFDSGFTQTAPPVQAANGASKAASKGIALATAPADTSFGAVSDDGLPAATAPPSRLGEDTLEGWGLRGSAGEKKDLSLAEIRNMALAGTINARTMVKRPGAEWMPAGQFAPLRAVFAGVAETSRGATAARERIEAEALPPAMAMLLAWGGALAGATIAGMGWWLAALVAGQEVVPLAALGGLFGGFAATWLSRTDGKMAAIPGALAGALAPLVGRYLVFLTLHSGVATLGSTEAPPSAMAFIESGMTPAFGISVVASILLGLLLGFVGAGKTR